MTCERPRRRMWCRHEDREAILVGGSLMTDPLTGAATIVGLSVAAKPAIDLVKDFLGRLLTPTGDALGTALAHPIVEWQKRRVERANRLVQDAAGAVAASGLEPHPVPGRLLMPIIDRGSLEEDAALHERWVSLLASAATRPGEIPPSFITVLAELSPVEAQVLQRVYDLSIDSRTGQVVGYHARGHVFSDFELTDTQIEVTIANLDRLALVGRRQGVPSPLPGDQKIMYERSTFLHLTRFGEAFLLACSRIQRAPGSTG